MLQHVSISPVWCFVSQMFGTFSHKRHKTGNYFHRNTQLSLRSKRTRFTPYTSITPRQQRNNANKMFTRITRATHLLPADSAKRGVKVEMLNVRLKIVHADFSCSKTTRFNTAAFRPGHLFPLTAIPDLANGYFLTGNLCRPVRVVHESNRFASPDTTTLITNPSTGRQWQ